MLHSFRIGIDCRLAGSQHAGIGRYTLELVRALTERGGAVHWVLFYRDETQQQEIVRAVGVKLHTNCTYVQVRARHYTMWEQFEMWRAASAARLDLLHVPHFNIPVLYQGPLVVTIHDLLWHQHRGNDVTTLPKWQYQLKYQGYRFVTAQAIKKAKVIFTPTHTVKNTIVDLVPAAASKCVVTYEGLSPLHTPNSPDRPQPSRPYILYVGSLYPHKNISVVLQALQALPNLDLHIVTGRSIFLDRTRQQIEQYNVAERVEILSGTTDEELALQYSQAIALIQPSRSEGFGLTGLEAMQLDTPVIASDIPVLREVYQDGALFFNPEAYSELVAHIQRLRDKKTLAALRMAGKAVVKQYSWKNVAEQVHNSYCSILD